MIEISIVLFGILVGLAGGFVFILLVALAQLAAAELHAWRIRRGEVRS